MKIPIEPPAPPPRQLYPASQQASSPQFRESPLDSVTLQLSNLSVCPTATPPPPIPRNDGDIEFPFLLISEPRPGGEPNQVHQDCSGSRTLDYTCSWHYLPAVPDALICTNCFHRHISTTPLAPAFSKAEKPSGRCRFHGPRVLLTLWPAARRTGRTDDLARFLARRLAIPECRSWAGAPPGSGIKFFSPTAGAPRGFAACEACYEDHVAGSPFAGRFAPTAREQGAAETWRCDFAGPVVARALRRFAGGYDGWERWAGVAAHRIYLPGCDGAQVAAASRRWFRRRGAAGARRSILVCEACYLDRAALTRFEGEFEPLPAPLPAGTLVACGFKVAGVEVSWALSQGMRNSNPFWNAANAFVSSGGCSVTGSQGGTWHCLKGPNKFTICPVCFAGIIQPMRAGGYFLQETRDQATTTVCSLTAGGPRVVEYFNRLAEALETGVWARFAGYVRKWAGVPPCPKDRLGTGPFYGFAEGFPDIAACKNCYEKVIRGTRFDSAVVRREEVTGLDGTELKTICSFFSPRMRGLWADACSSGELEQFMGIARMRVQVWIQTVPKWDLLLASAKMAQQRGMTTALVSVAYQGMENVTVASCSHQSDFMYSSHTGWHETRQGALSATYAQEMMGSFSQSLSGDIWMQMATLEKRWNQVI